ALGGLGGLGLLGGDRAAALAGTGDERAVAEGGRVGRGPAAGPAPLIATGYLLIGIMMCAPGVPASISHGRPSPPIDSSRRRASDTPIVSGVAPGTDSTHSS